ncbi:MAG: endonuclease V [Bacteroidota bacterium]
MKTNPVAHQPSNPPRHSWALSPKEAVAVQRAWAERVELIPLGEPPATIAGLDVSVRDGQVQTAIVVLRLADLETIDEAIWRGPVPFPYISGLLSFREIPSILPAYEKLRVEPDVLMLDGQGLAHPRRFGLACHLGVWLGKPAFGVAKTRLIGVYEEPGTEKGSQSALLAKKTSGRLGTVLRTRSNVKPVYVSPGHLITLREAEALTLNTTTRYKIPEPTRRAHLLSRS